MMFRRIRTQIQCQHLYARSIHGDEIIQSGYKRGHCGECGAWLDDLPLGFRATSPNRRLVTETDAAGARDE